MVQKHHPPSLIQKHQGCKSLFALFLDSLWGFQKINYLMRHFCTVWTLWLQKMRENMEESLENKSNFYPARFFWFWFVWFGHVFTIERKFCLLLRASIVIWVEKNVNKENSHFSLNIASPFPKNGTNPHKALWILSYIKKGSSFTKQFSLFCFSHV